MVKLSRFIVFLLMLPTLLLAQNVKVEANVNERTIIENEPIRGTVTITHDQNQSIDRSSFRIDGDPLKVEYVKSVQLTPTDPLQVSIFQFEIPGKPVVLYALDEISVRVAGRWYESIPRTFEVTKRATIPRTAQNGLLLELQAFVDGDRTLYPGQRVKLIYRYRYNVNFDLIAEELPLLDPKGFRKIGGKQVAESEEGNVSILEVAQEVEAVTPGVYTFGPSFIEGRPYIVRSMGEKQYGKDLLRSEVPPITLTIEPIPDTEKPTAFNGAVGQFRRFSVSLEPDPKIMVGDKLVLKVEITGSGDMENVPLPDLCCQPGMSGMFRLSDLPPVGELKGSTKVFYVEVRPLTAIAKEIPSFTFAYFDPKTEQYQTLHSEPIPVQVNPAPANGLVQTKLKPETEQGWDAVPKPIEIEGNYPLTTADLHDLPLGNWWALFLIPFGVGLILLQLQLKQFLTKQKQEKREKKSKDLFEEMMVMQESLPHFFQKLNRLFLLRLHELGEIKDPDIAPELLSREGKVGQVREFLRGIEKRRFAGEEVRIDTTLLEEVKRLFEKLGGSR